MVVLGKGWCGVVLLVVSGLWFVVCGLWFVVCDRGLEFGVCGLWLVVMMVWGMVGVVPNVVVANVEP